ncbi:MAG TPA: Asp-tRNA(Asn)/Glu-tRNA(Gln) amidotransferase subunit GatC [Gemmatimonadales bacterium]|nr:Asp-tRNA(Asn)/Glu-tRNA(Gln) amidotransferase subunit GatC [Gemmatimonadales bacterium]
MRITREEVLHIAKLAELQIPDAELERVTDELCRICDYVDQLNEVPIPSQADPFAPGPGRVGLREDIVRPTRLAHAPSAFAPEFVDGFFLVPKLDGMEEE